MPAVVRVLGEAFFHDAREHRLIHYKRLRLAIHDRGDERGLTVAAEGSLAGEDFVEHAAEGKNIGARIGRLALQLLG